MRRQYYTVGKIGIILAVLFMFQFTTAYAVIQNIPPCYQSDYSQMLFMWNDEPKSVETSGCGAACAAMVLGYFYGDKAPGPETLFLWAYNNGHYRGNGLGHQAIISMLEPYSVKTVESTPYNYIVTRALETGKVVIASVGSGLFTTYGHYIIIRGVDAEGQLLVIDPNSRSKSEKAYDAETLYGQVKCLLICEMEQL